MASTLNPLLIRRRLGRGNWAAPIPFGPDGWRLLNFSGDGSIILTCAPAGEVNDDWVHASISWTDHMPTYADLKLLHDAVFCDGWAYQVFAPPSEHVNIREHALHLFGRLDGKAALPDFTYGSGSI
ncbi:MAG: hypothetical protein QOE61_3055 [Micromonosporaceae bacterium]|uniref:DUF7694 domain-containing protein n=1 Tax=Mycobacterium sp. TaxID=1785 RepID=UPI0028B58DF1|nr:hypothetical protein [Mycobacterium sp.]MDT5026629.1 hypothetical protein [Micromonosporaceae bacterium]MDT5119270.1 hypothetical protein [Mycobacterium sp.]